MISYNFEIPGKVQAKQRPRFNGKFAYTPAKTKYYENWVKECFLSTYNNPQVIIKPVKVEIIAYFCIPTSTSKKKREQMLDYKIFPTVKPDTDNIAKSILDSLNGIAYVDDKQVVKLEVEKYYANVPKVVVKISEIEIENT